jgi:SAM-dependent methyltransferase
LAFSSEGAAIACLNQAGNHRFPVVDGVPILLNESTSIFSIADYRPTDRTSDSHFSRLQRFALARLRSTRRNAPATANFERLGRLLLEGRSHASVLVVGGSIVGRGMEGILSRSEIEFVETDVVFGPRTQVICDAHDLPFADRSFDGVVVQAVLEHVVDPVRCVEEIYRVLKDDGLVYAETPFMQQVHLGRYDFTRFTHLGHRRLFRRFAEVDSGATAGPGTVLAWSYEHFLLSFARRRISRGLVKLFARCSGFWLKYLDVLVEGNPGVLDSASGYWFLGRKSARTLSDRELVRLYRGAQGRAPSDAVAHPITQRRTVEISRDSDRARLRT